MYLAYCLRRSQSLRVLHLCGNLSRPRYKIYDKTSRIEIEDPMKAIINRVIERLHAKTPPMRAAVIKPYNHLHKFEKQKKMVPLAKFGYSEDNIEEPKF